MKPQHNDWQLVALQEERASYVGSLMWESGFLLVFAVLGYYTHTFAVVVPAAWVGLLTWQTLARLRELNAQLRQPAGFTIRDDYPPQISVAET